MKYVDEIIQSMDTELHRIQSCLDLLTEEQVWYRLKPGMNSVGNLCLHLAGNEYQHFVSGVGKKQNIKQRTLEFTSEKAYTKNRLKDLLTKTRNESLGILSRLSEEEIRMPVKVDYSQEDWIAMTGRNSEDVEENPAYTRNVQIILFQVCEHYGYHTGQIVLLTKLLTNIDQSISGYKH